MNLQIVFEGLLALTCFGQLACSVYIVLLLRTLLQQKKHANQAQPLEPAQATPSGGLMSKGQFRNPVPVVGSVDWLAK